MGHFGEFIDYDEGRDFDPREAFYAEALPCESCGAPCEDRQKATWDTELMVGPCCQLDASEIPEMPICEELYRITMRCVTVGELSEAFSVHRKVCRKCNPDAQVGLPEAA